MVRPENRSRRPTIADRRTGGDPARTTAPPDVAIFRHNLFRISEPFITQQAGSLHRYKPFYLGRLRFGPPPDGVASHALEDLTSLAFPSILGQMITRDPRPYLRVLDGRRPCLLHAHFGIEGVYAMEVAERLEIPLITTFHGFDATLSTASLLRSPAWANFPLHRRALARRGDLFLCASSFVRDRVLAMGFPEARTRTHYIGVDCGAIVPRDPTEEDGAVVLHVGRLVEVKGAEILIRAFAALPKTRTAAELVLIGDGPLKGKLESLVRSLGIGERVRFLGALPHVEVLAWMRRAAVLAVPSVRTASGRIEGLGMVALEAAATGVPAVGSRVGGIPEAIVDGRTGFLLPPGDVGALAARLDALLGDRGLRSRFGLEGRAHAERRFDLRRQTAELETLYDEVLAERGRPWRAA